METKVLTDMEVKNLSYMCKEMNKYDLEPIFDLLSFEYHIQDLERAFGDLISLLAKFLTNNEYYDEEKCSLAPYPPAYENSIYLLTRFRETFIKMQENAEKKKFEMQLIVIQKPD